MNRMSLLVSALAVLGIASPTLAHDKIVHAHAGRTQFSPTALPYCRWLAVTVMHPRDMLKCNLKYIVAILLFVVSPAAVVYAEVSEATKRINSLLDKVPSPEIIEIEYREIAGLAGRDYRWHIKGTSFWVDLYPIQGHSIDNLDKSKKYAVEGIAIGQDYGVVHIWTSYVRESVEKW